MAQGSLIVSPGTPELAESVLIRLSDVEPLTRWELKIDDKIVTTYTTDAEGNLTTSFDAEGFEVELANFGGAEATQPRQELMRLSLIDYQHSVRLERV